MALYDWKSFLLFSEWILVADDTLKPDEATITRNVISRSYYAAFHIAQEFLKQNGYWDLERTGTEHRKAWHILAKIKKRDKSFQDKCHTIGNMLRDLCDKRNDADYKADKPVSLRDAEVAHRSANKIIQKINEL